jgi:hypothetical protein
MTTKSGKAKSKSRYTDVHTILEEIDREKETEIVGGQFITLTPKWRNIFWNGKFFSCLMPLFEINNIKYYLIFFKF